MRAWIWAGLALLAGCGFSGVNAEDGAGGTGPTNGPDGGFGAAGSGGSGGDLTLNEGAGREESTPLPASGTGGGGGGGGAGVTGLAPACAGKENSARTLKASLSSANSHASAGLARDFLNSGLSPLPVWVRTQDFLNSYALALDKIPPPTSASDPKLLVQLGAGLEPGTYHLLIAAEAPTLPSPDQRWATFVLDTTPSMTGAGLSRAKAAITAVVKRMKAGDVARVLTTNPGDPEIVIDPGSAAADLEQLASIGIGPEVSPVSALERALQDAAAAPATSARRVILVGDGDGDPGQLQVSQLESAAAAGQLVAAIATGPAERHQDRFYRAATVLGRGLYLYLDDVTKADTRIGDHFDALFAIAFDDVQLELDLPWYFDRLENPTEQLQALDAARAQYLASGGRCTFLFTLRACDPNAISLVGGTVDVVLNWQGGSVSASNSAYALDAAPAKAELAKAVLVFDYAEALKTLDKQRISNATQSAQDLAMKSSDGDIGEIAKLLAKHPALQGP